MKVAIVEVSAFGGLLHYAVQLGDGLAGRGHQVEVIAPKENEMSVHAGPVRMRNVLAAPSRPSDVRPASATRRFLKRAGVAVRLVAAWAGVVRAVWGGRYDVVIINSSIYHTIGAIGALALGRFSRGADVVGIMHNAQPLVEEVQLGEHRPSLLDRIIDAVVQRYELVFVHGERSVETLKATWPHKAVVSIPHGDERAFAEEPPPPADHEHILFFGHWNWAKGIPVLIEAFDLIATMRPTATLTMAGMPDPQQVDIAEIHAWSERHRGKIELIEEYVPIEKVYGLFASSRVVVAPYVAGYQSGVVHLAMTMARAVVATDVGDLAAAVVDGKTGFIVPPEDPAALASALDRVLGDPALAARFGTAGHTVLSSRANWGVVAEQVEEALLALQPGSS